MRPTRLAFAFVLALSARAGVLHAQAPAGPEFQVNVFATKQQRQPAVAADGGGNFVVAWSAFNGFFWLNVEGRRYDAAGTPLSGEFKVSSGTHVYQVYPAVAASPSGAFVVAWTGSTDSANPTVYGRRFDAAGVPLAADFVANTSPVTMVASPSVAVAPGGHFIVAWTAGHITGQLYDASGQPRGGEFFINTAPTGIAKSALAADGAGGFLAVWTSQNGVAGQRLDANGAPVGGEFAVNVTTGPMPARVSVAAAGSGDFVVAWDGPTGDVLARRVSAAGVPLGAELVANASTTGTQSEPSVAADAQGTFTVAWTSRGQDGAGAGVVAQRFDASGVRRGREFRVNTSTTAAQFEPVVAALPEGASVVVWTGWKGLLGLGPQEELPPPIPLLNVYGQRLAGLQAEALAADPAGNGVWEPGESVELRPTWRNLAGAPLSLDGELSNLAGPAGATYSIADPVGTYGAVADGAAATCADCYGVAVSDPAVRPALHWDARATETITGGTPGLARTWTLHVGRSFADVPVSSPFYRFVETLLHTGVTAGCAATTFCPDAATTRDQMAVFVLAAKEGAGYAPPACTTPVFDDVPASSPFCRFIEELFRRGVVNGCGGGSFCPTAPVTREQMAVFTLRTLDPTLDPPACGTPVFSDVPATSPFCRWVEELARRHVVGGCGGGNYCPGAPVTREQMGVFLGVTFGLTLYGP